MGSIAQTQLNIRYWISMKEPSVNSVHMNVKEKFTYCTCFFFPCATYAANFDDYWYRNEPLS